MALARQGVIGEGMPNGKPGDHPLTDIFKHRIEAYGPEADDLIRRIQELSGPDALHEWWEREISSVRDNDEVLRRARARHDELLKRTKP